MARAFWARWQQAIAACVLLILCAQMTLAQPCGVTQSLKSWQEERLSTLETAINEALIRMDTARIPQLLQQQRLVLGVEAGYAASAEDYVRLPTRMRWLTLAQVAAQSKKVVNKYPEVFDNLPRLAKGFQPQTTDLPDLSPVAAAEIGLALLQLANAGAEDELRTQLIQMGLQTLDSLLLLRKGGGMFPFLNLKGQDITPHALLRRYYPALPTDTLPLQARKWLNYDYGTGQSFGVNGVLLRTYCLAYQETNYAAYKTAAERLAVQLLSKAPVASIRYSAELVSGLAMASVLLEDADYLARAKQITTALILPAQLRSGRWPDGQDAAANTHGSILEALIQLERTLAEDDPLRPRLRGAILRAARSLYTEFATCGGTAEARWVFSLQTMPHLPVGLQDSLRLLTGRLLQAPQPWTEDVVMLAAYAQMIKQTKAKLDVAEYAQLEMPPQGTTTLDHFPISPSPFSDYALISFELAEAVPVRLEVRNARGKVVAELLDETKEPGMYHIRWDSVNQPAGTYLFQLTIKGRGYLRRAQLVR